jgi:hypothetical protein
VINPFTRHPNSINETYVEHLCVAWRFGLKTFTASLACFVHGVFPFFFTSTGSSAIKRLHEDMQRRSTYEKDSN